MMLQLLCCMVALAGTSLCSSRDIVGVDISSLGAVLDLSLCADGTCKVVSLKDGTLSFTNVNGNGKLTPIGNYLLNDILKTTGVEIFNDGSIAVSFSRDKKLVTAWIEHNQRINLFCFDADTGEKECNIVLPFKTIFDRYALNALDRTIASGRYIVDVDYNRGNGVVTVAYGLGSSYTVDFNDSSREENTTMLPPFHRLHPHMRSIIMGETDLPALLNGVRQHFKASVPAGSVLIGYNTSTDGEARRLVYSKAEKLLRLLGADDKCISSLGSFDLELTTYDHNFLGSNVIKGVETMDEHAGLILDRNGHIASINRRLFTIPQQGNVEIPKKKKAVKPSSFRWLLRPRTIGLVVGVAVTTATCFYAWQYLRAPLRALP